MNFPQQPADACNRRALPQLAQLIAGEWRESGLGRHSCGNIQHSPLPCLGAHKEKPAKTGGPKGALQRENQRAPMET
jgi:hypothetical protein